MGAVDSSFEVGLRLRFLLHANDTVKRGGRNHAIRAADALVDWLGARAKAWLQNRCANCAQREAGRQQTSDREKTWRVVRFSGALQVVQSEDFTNALRYALAEQGVRLRTAVSPISRWVRRWKQLGCSALPVAITQEHSRLQKELLSWMNIN